MIFSRQHARNRLRIGDVFLLENALCERMGIILLQDWHGFLQDDDTVVQLLVNKVHSAARDLYSIVKCLLLRIEPREGRQQRWMDVKNALGKCLNKFCGEQTHIARQADKVHVMLLEAGNDFGVMLGTLTPTCFYCNRGKASLDSRRQTGRVGFVGDDDCDLGVLQSATGNGIGNREKIRSPPRKKDA